MPNKISKRNPLWIYLLFSIMILAAYANSFTVSWHFDDKANILNNRHLHIKDLYPSTLVATLYSNPKNPYELAEKMYRPVACLSFAMNWYIGQNNPFGYHVTNVILHLITTLLLYFFIQAFYQTPHLKEAPHDEKRFIPILATALWALNPIQTQAVVYIVQRMAVLAAMFYILGMLSYLKGRTSASRRERISGFSACFICYLFALGSKENAVLMPLMIIFMEFAFFQDLGKKSTRYWLGGIILAAGVGVALAGILLFLKGDPGKILRGYSARPFDLLERLLTETRIIVHYLSQIFYPLPTRLSIEHDVLLSKSLFQPWTTLPACMMVIGWFAAGILLLRKYALIGFSLLFFMVNHIIESSIIPLELFFEHRNYLPSMLVFIPISVGSYKLVDFYKKKGSIIRPILYGFIILLVLGFAVSTHIRNRAWKSERSLWLDAAEKAPQSARPLTSLAWDMTYGQNADQNNYDNALKLYQLALRRHMPRLSMKASILINMADIHTKKGDLIESVALLKEALKAKPGNKKARFDLATNYLRLGHLEAASQATAPLIIDDKTHEGQLNLKAVILLRQGKAPEAVTYLEKSLALAPYFNTTLLYMGMALNLSGDHQKAMDFLLKSYVINPKDPLPLLCLIDNSLRSGNQEQAMEFAERVASLFPADVVFKTLSNDYHNHLVPLLMKDDIVANIDFK